MVNRVVVVLEQYEYSALLKMAINDLRNPGDELRHILRLEIDRRSTELSIIDEQKLLHPDQETIYE
jgi:hypothetical protein